MIPCTVPGFLFWGLLVFGVAYLGTAAAITEIPRRFVYLLLPTRVRGVLECAPCFSFWVGALLGAFGGVPCPWALPSSVAGVVASAGLGGVMACALVAAFQGWTGWYIAEYDARGSVSSKAEQGALNPEGQVRFLGGPPSSEAK